jgi:hypothetical protein
VKLFLDTSVILAAICSDIGASRELFRIAQHQFWQLIATPYVLSEVETNLVQLPNGEETWNRLRPGLTILEDVLVLDWPVVFEPAKDRPILFSALAWAEILLTLDQQDFGKLMDGSFYGLRIMRPGVFLLEQRTSGILR